VTSFRELISDLRGAESQLVKQLEGIRMAIASLDMGSPVSPSMPDRQSRRPRVAATGRKRRRMSPAARKAVSLRMKKYWAQRRKSRA
jgi:hypothetical protein